jgi:hypothetical protein
MTTITWTVSSLDYEVSKDGLDNVATVAHWRCTGVDADGNVGLVYGTKALPAPSADDFMPWYSITEKTVLGWLVADMATNKMDDTPTEQESVEAVVQAQIDEKANPTRGTGVPWAVAPETRD